MSEVLAQPVARAATATSADNFTAFIMVFPLIVV
jgi:hypothetical protein